MLTYIHSLILGIVEGLTEFLPISSTAHLVLVSDILKISQTNFVKTFEIAIQSGAILAVIVLYWRKFLNWGIFKKVTVAFIPTAIIGLIFYKIIKNYLIGNITVILIALSLGGLLLIIFERYYKRKNLTQDSLKDLDSMSMKDSFIVGLSQSVAMVPGVSRSAATIIGGLARGIKREAIVEFSFLLAVPTMLAATGLDILKNLNEFSSANIGTLSIGFVAAFITAIISIKFLLNYVRKNNFIPFGIYRILIVIVFLFLL